MTIMIRSLKNIYFGFILAAVSFGLFIPAVFSEEIPVSLDQEAILEKDAELERLKLEAEAKKRLEAEKKMQEQKDVSSLNEEKQKNEIVDTPVSNNFVDTDVIQEEVVKESAENDITIPQDSEPQENVIPTPIAPEVDVQSDRNPEPPVITPSVDTDIISENKAVEEISVAETVTHEDLPVENSEPIFLSENVSEITDQSVGRLQQRDALRLERMEALRIQERERKEQDQLRRLRDQNILEAKERESLEISMNNRKARIKRITWISILVLGIILCFLSLVYYAAGKGILMNLKDFTMKSKLIFAFSVFLILILIEGLISIQKSSDYVKLSRMVRFMIEKEVDHFKWVAQIKDLFLNNQSELKVQTDFHKCGLGEWYYSFISSKEFKSLPETLQRDIEKIEGPHQKLHESALEIIELYRPIHPNLELTLRMRLDDHRKWVQSIAMALIEGKEIVIETDPTKCALGQWLFSDEVLLLQAQWPEFASLISRINTYHDALHNSVIKINKANDKETKIQIFRQDVEADIDEIVKLFDGIITLEKKNQEGFENAQEILMVQTERVLAELLEIYHHCLSQLNELGEAAQETLRVTIIVVVAASVLIAIMLIAFLMKTIMGPIQNVVLMLKDIAQGEGDLTKRIQIDANDEMGELSKWFNDFVSNIDRIIREVKDAAQQLSIATEEISTSSQQISNGAQQQSASFEELTSSVQTNNENVIQANQISSNVTENAHQADKAMQDTLDAMSTMEKSSSQIAEAINIITDIADQTNLLALNAAIEAARAGEHGKGFAVVADEVRQLAERSALSAKDISSLITDTLKQVENGVAVSKNAGDNLKMIISDINKVAESIKMIATATQEQAAAMEENSSITESNAASSEELAASSEQIASQSDALKQLVERFKVSDWGKN